MDLPEMIVLDEIPDNRIYLGQIIDGKMVVSIRYVFEADEVDETNER